MSKATAIVNLCAGRNFNKESLQREVCDLVNNYNAAFQLLRMARSRMLFLRGRCFLPPNEVEAFETDLNLIHNFVATPRKNIRNDYDVRRRHD